MATLAVGVATLVRQSKFSWVALTLAVLLAKTSDTDDSFSDQELQSSRSLTRQ